MVIILAQCILRDSGRSLLRGQIGVVIIKQQTHNTLRSRDELSWIETFVKVALHVFHLPVHALFEPLIQSWDFFHQLARLRNPH